jgi:hypothetical protein
LDDAAATGKFLAGLYERNCKPQREKEREKERERERENEREIERERPQPVGETFYCSPTVTRTVVLWPGVFALLLLCYCFNLVFQGIEYGKQFDD